MQTFSFVDSQQEKTSATPPPEMNYASATGTFLDDYSPIPGASMTSNSSPGSASDHMGGMPELPNPFLSVTTSSNADLAPNWGSAPSPTGTHVPDTVTSYSPELEGQIAASTSSGFLESSSTTTTREGGKPTAARKRQTTKNRSDGGGDAPTARRQKRLERNRESARLSRRRRKQYLEVLEERVTQLSHDLDHGRRAHVSKAVDTILEMRRQLLEGQQANAQSLPLLEATLARTSAELMVSNTFQVQQLKSFFTSPSDKFILWLTLQTDVYFRGGRAASERLSAARIGERMLNNGTNTAAPSQSMWPLFCNEVGLSYDQEEKVRAFQRTLLQTQESWLDRHTSYAAGKVIESHHDTIQAMSLRLGQRERSNASILSPEQRARFLSWANRNKERTARANIQVQPAEEMFKVSNSHHTAANLYIVNHSLREILKKVSRAAPMVTGLKLKKLSRRPCFESLGCRSGTDKSHMEDGYLSRESSFASTGSLKRSASEISMDGEERPVVPSISPEEAEATASPAVEKVLGFLKEIIPPPPTPAAVWAPSNIAIPAPTPVSSMTLQQPVAFVSTDSLAQQTLMAPYSPQVGSSHIRKNSFLPEHLHVVPEEMWPADAADDLLMNLAEEDWAIGEGFDMEV